MGDKPPSRKLKVVLAIGDSLMRRRMREILEGDERFAVIGEAADGNGAVATALKTRPEVVVLDEELSELDGPEVARRILRDRPQTQLFYLGRGPDEGEAPLPWSYFRMTKDVLPDDAVEFMRRHMQAAA